MHHENRCRREIKELREFFEGWLSGTLPETAEAFGRVEDILAIGFQLIDPSGECRMREEVFSGLLQTHESNSSLTVEIRGRAPSFRGRDGPRRL